MKFSNIIGLDDAFLNQDKYKLFKVYCRDAVSEYSPSNGTTGILIRSLGADEPAKCAPKPRKKSLDEVMQAEPAQAVAASPNPGTGLFGGQLYGKKKERVSVDDNVLFPFANLRHRGEFVVRKIRRMGDIHASELIMNEDPFVLHETARVIELPALEPIEFDLIMPDVYSHGAVSMQTTSPVGLMKAFIHTLKNASTFFKYNCLLKMRSNIEYMNSKYGPATCALSIIRPGQFLPVFGEEDGCIIHIHVANTKAACIDVVCLASNNAEAIFDVDGDVLYDQSYRTAFTTSTIPNFKKYSKYISATFPPIPAEKGALAPGR